MKPYDVADHEYSLLPEGKKWKLVWNDEFDGKELDYSKWSFRRHIMGCKHDTYTDEEGIELDGNSNLIFRVIEKDGKFYSCQLQTGENYMDRPGDTNFKKFTWPIAKISTPKFMHKFGYYECRARLQRKAGWWSAFWLQSPCQGSTLNPAVSGVEMDIIESFSPGVVMHNIHWDGCGADWKRAGKPEFEIWPGDENDFHRFGMLWDKSGYTFYIDGQESWHVDGPVSEIEQFILISTECLGYRFPGEIPHEGLKEAAKDDSFVVDYIRVFDEVQ